MAYIEPAGTSSKHNKIDGFAGAQAHLAID